MKFCKNLHNMNHTYTTSFKIAAIITMSFILTGIIAAVVNNI